MMPSLMPSNRLWPAWAVSLGIVLLAAAALWWLGRVWWCACGSWTPWSWDVHSMHNSQHVIDPYTFSHIQHGLLLYGGLWLLFKGTRPGLRIVLAVALESAWEVGENTDRVIEAYRESTISLDYYGDSIINSLADIAVCMAGYAAASVLAVWISAACFVAIELALIVLIRDSLSLNVLMLLWPIEAVKQWQSGG